MNENILYMLCSCAAILLKKRDGKCGKDEIVRNGRIIACPVDDESFENHRSVNGLGWKLQIHKVKSLYSLFRTDGIRNVEGTRLPFDIIRNANCQLWWTQPQYNLIEVIIQALRWIAEVYANLRHPFLRLKCWQRKHCKAIAAEEISFAISLLQTKYSCSPYRMKLFDFSLLRTGQLTLIHL